MDKLPKLADSGHKILTASLALILTHPRKTVKQKACLAERQKRKKTAGTLGYLNSKIEEMCGKETAGLVFGCEEFTNLLSFPFVGKTQMIQVQLSLVHSLFSVTSPGSWAGLPAGRFKIICWMAG